MFGLSSVSWTPFADRIPNWSRLLTVLGVGFLVGMSLRFLLDRDLGEFVLLVKKRSCRASQNSKKIGNMCNIRDVPFKPLVDELEIVVYFVK
ncbi:unnamed protein product [Prunus brigantina]